jgi:hypothetical protein
MALKQFHLELPLLIWMVLLLLDHQQQQRALILQCYSLVLSLSLRPFLQEYQQALRPLFLRLLLRDLAMFKVLLLRSLQQFRNS